MYDAITVKSRPSVSLADKTICNDSLDKIISLSPLGRFFQSFASTVWVCRRLHISLHNKNKTPISAKLVSYLYIYNKTWQAKFCVSTKRELLGAYVFNHLFLSNDWNISKHSLSTPWFYLPLVIIAGCLYKGREVEEEEPMILGRDILIKFLPKIWTINIFP